MAACKVCGAPHVTCGPPSASLVAIPTYRKSEESNVALHEYHQTIRGIDTTVLLSDEDAERAGLTASDRVAHSTYIAPDPEADDASDPEADESDDAAGSEAVPQLTAEEVDTVRAFLAELKAARAEEGQNVDDGNPDDQTGADSGEGEKQQDAPANKAARRPRNKAAANPAATE